MSTSESSSYDEEGFYGCPEYEIEDECCETTSKDGNESEPSYTVEEGLLDSMDALPYTDEPLADESWVEAYVARQEEYTREMRELSLRLNGQNPVNSWCNCGCCNAEYLVDAKECHCCSEIPKCVDALNLTNSQESKSSQPLCITNHPGFDAICLNRWSLELASDHFKTRSGHKYQQVDTKERFLLVVAYRQFTRLIYGYLNNKRIPLPACAYHAIRTAFKTKDGDFSGYEDLDEEN